MLRWTDAEQESMLSILDRFKDRRVLLLGDFILDRWVYGTIRRISREAPVFIVESEEETIGPGAAANTAVQLRTLGAAVTAVGWVGEDGEGSDLVSLLGQKGIAIQGILAIKNTHTVVKTRFVAGSPYSVRQQILRVDKGVPLTAEMLPLDAWSQFIEDHLEASDVLVISDYGYGINHPSLLESVIHLARKKGIPVVGDSRFHLARLEGATLVTPNEPEFSQAVATEFRDIEELREHARKAREKWRWDALLITRGSQGMFLVDRDQDWSLEVFGPKVPVDVTGAGDTVLAVVALALSVSKNLPLCAMLANIAGGLAVAHKGVYQVPSGEIRQAILSSQQENTTFSSSQSH